MLCISPLNSLMMDQKWSFLTCGISVEFVSKAHCDKEVIKQVLSGYVPLVLISPESIASSSLYQNTLVFEDIIIKRELWHMLLVRPTVLKCGMLYFI